MTSTITPATIKQQWDLSDNYPSLPTNDPVCTEGPYRVTRGDSRSNDARRCRSASRYSAKPGLASIPRGFRVTLVP